MGCALLFLAACAKHLEFPPVWDQLPTSAKLDILPSIKKLTIRYNDSCGEPQEIPLGDQLQEALRERIHRAFKTVTDERDGDTIAPDHVIQVDLVESSFDLNKETLHGRPPAVLHLNAIARIHDRTGALLRQTDIKIAHQEQLRLEQFPKNCSYMIDPFIRDAAIEFATRVSLYARQAVAGQSPASSAEPSPMPAGSVGASASIPSETPHTPASPSQALRFKAMLLDENSNLIFEGGEHVRVRVDVVNAGTRSVENVLISLTGTQSIIEQFPAATLPIQSLQAGQTKSVEFIAALLPTKQAQQVVIHVTVSESAETAAPSQTLSLTLQPAAVGTDDVNQIPAPALGFHRPQTFLISIGVGTYRDPKLTPRRYAATDAETVAAYFQSLGGVPPSNIRQLQNQKAFRADINEALFGWLPLHAAMDAVVIVYFSGQAMVTPTGDVFLAPYDGNPTDLAQLYPLNDLKSAFARLKAEHVIFLFDGMVSKPRGKAKQKTATPRWELGEGNTFGLIGGEDFTKGLEDDQRRHSLFTYYLLKGLRGEADTNRNGTVTFGELAGYVRQKVAWAAKSQFNQEQRPLLFPPLKPDDTAASLILTALPSLSSSEAP